MTGLHMGAVDTDMMAGFDIDKLDPAGMITVPAELAALLLKVA